MLPVSFITSILSTQKEYKKAKKSAVIYRVDHNENMSNRSVYKLIDGNPRPHVFFDTETTGLDPETHGIWEIGAVRYDWENRMEELSFMVRVDKTNASLEALDISGFHDRYQESMALPIDLAIERLLDFSRDAVIFGLNPSFDVSFLRATARRENLQFDPEWYYSIIDVKSYASGALGLSPMTPSHELAQKLGVSVDPTVRHSALGDSHLTADIYYATRERKR